MIGGKNMKDFINNKISFLILSFFLFLCPLVVNATGTATTGFSGNSSVYVGNTIDITLYVGSVSGTTNNGGLAAFGGNLSYPSNLLELVSTSSLAPFNVELVNNKFGGFGANTITGYSNIMKLTFRAKATGSATISYTGSSQPDASASPVTISGCSKTVTIANPPSSNNNLSSLSVSSGSLNFNKNTTSYTVNVDTNVTSVNISASAEDSSASITGTGTKNLNYGNNTFSITVTAPSGDKKTYTVTVNRKDSRSSNNKLSSLSVNSGELSPKFNSDTESYSLSVPYSVSTLKVDAKASDSKASVSVTNTSLTAEETTDVKIVVTAENGSTKTYTIHTTRGKDPNKVLSTNNYLSSLTVSSGILSPTFSKEQTEYIVYLPYEVDTVSFDAIVEDTKYATVSIEGPDSLAVGNNNYKIKVTAEDSSVKEYTVIVSRGINLVESDVSSNTNIKSIKLKNGSLIGTFNSDKKEYYYTRKDNFEIEEVTLEDENSTVNIIEDGKTIYLLVTSQSGEQAIYALRVKNYFYIFIYILIFILGVIAGILFTKLNKKIKSKKKVKDNQDIDKNKEKKRKKNKKIKKEKTNEIKN